MKDAEKLLLQKYENSDLIYEGSLEKGDYLYGWFNEKDSSTLDGVHINRINLKTNEIEENFGIPAVMEWGINLNDFKMKKEASLASSL